MHVENKQNCTGCGACYNICPKGTISMQGDDYGFYKPIIDIEKCIDCGLCEKICPIDQYKSQNLCNPKTYAFMNSDEVRAKSSSGGAFSAFADFILGNNGIVYGVVWDENIIATHYRAATLKEVEKMHGSKYVQSNTKDTFKKVKEDLESGKSVLFSGTPCQIAGLKSYLQKDYENLLTVDIICHGTQAPLFLERYKKEFLRNKKNEKILNINFRSKNFPWGTGYHTVITTNKKNYTTDNIYVSSMDLTLNECCITCQFTGIPRIADVTIGDFWGVDEYNSSLNDTKGTSIILLNSEKSLNIFNIIKNKYITQEIPTEVAIKRNYNIVRPSKEHSKRKDFLNKLLNPKISIKKLTSDPLYVCLYRLLPPFVKNFIKNKFLNKTK